ncbi:MAG: Gfo/Idh/MocA family oxidoreductase [Propionibacteriaceae bacterium]|nr:Gfo/Idh/MocA family oxidoreductase [Propionibacteriaceae bacterium]
MESIRWGIIGAGAVADIVAGDFAYVPRAELVAVAARSQERAERLASKHRILRAYGDYRALLEADDIDVVYIATTHPQHRDIALAAIAAGKAVLVEKAFTATLAGTEQVVQAARAAGVFAMEAMWTRFLPAVAAAREVVAWGRIGEVLGVQGDLCAFRPYDPENRLWNPDTGGGAVLDLGVYVVSMAQAFLGTARAVECVGRLAPNGVESAATMTIAYVGGGTSTLTCGFDLHGPGRMAVFGTKGWVEIEPRFHHPTTISVHRSGALPRIIEAKQTGRGYAHELMEVSDRLLLGETESTIMPLDDTVEVMKVLEDCLTQLGRPQQEARVTI